MHKKFTTTAIATTMSALLFLGACGSGEVQVGGQVTAPTQPSTTTTTTASGSSPVTTQPPVITGDELSVQVYFLADDESTNSRPGPYLIPVDRQLPYESWNVEGAINALLAGPTAAEAGSSSSLSSSVPANSTLLGVSITGLTVDADQTPITPGVAEINLSSGFEAGGGTFSITSRLAQLVYTATSLGEVGAVRLLIDGEPVDVFSSEGLVIDGPMTREDFTDFVPNILVEQPAYGETVTGPVYLRGTAAVFEAVFQGRLEANGAVLWEGTIQTSNGTGWGAFDTAIPYFIETDTEATLTVWEYSAEDGSIINQRTHQLTLQPWTSTLENGCPIIPGIVAIGAGELRFGEVALVQDLTGGVEVTIDEARFLTGQPAMDMAAASGEEAPAGFYIQGISSSGSAQVVASDAPICLIPVDGTSGFLGDRGYVNLTEVTPSEYAAVYNGSNPSDWYSAGRWVWYTVDGDTITSIVEQYLP